MFMNDSHVPTVWTVVAEAAALSERRRRSARLTVTPTPGGRQVLVRFLLPVEDNNGVAFPVSLLAECLHYIAEAAGGFTALEAIGVALARRIELDATVAVDVLLPFSHRATLRAALERVRVTLGQREIFAVATDAESWSVRGEEESPVADGVCVGSPVEEQRRAP